MRNPRTVTAKATRILLPALHRLILERDNFKEESAKLREEQIRLLETQERLQRGTEELEQEGARLQGERDVLYAKAVRLVEKSHELQEQHLRYKTWVPPGHDYSPIPNIESVRSREDKIFDRLPRELPGVNMNTEVQLALHDEFLKYYGAEGFDKTGVGRRRYYQDNNFFPYCDAFFLYSMIRHFRPKNIVEIGSGFSSAVMLDTIDDQELTDTNCTFIDPHPDRLLSLTKSEDRKRHRFVKRKIEDAPLSEIERLGHNDILFVDSSHVAKTGSDVNHIVFELLPRLRSGVLIHIHDVPFPFEYGRADVYEGRAWNEAYLMRAFLQFNPVFKILLYPSFVATLPVEPGQAQSWGAAWRDGLMPKCADTIGPSLWLRKC